MFSLVGPTGLVKLTPLEFGQRDFAVRQPSTVVPFCSPPAAQNIAFFGKNIWDKGFNAVFCRLWGRYSLEAQGLEL